MPRHRLADQAQLPVRQARNCHFAGETPVMGTLKSLSLSASVILALAGGASAIAQEPNYPWVEMDSTSIGLGLAGQTGEGVLHLPNLGTNCTYPFRVSGFGGGLQAGV